MRGIDQAVSFWKAGAGIGLDATAPEGDPLGILEGVEFDGHPSRAGIIILAGDPLDRPGRLQCRPAYDRIDLDLDPLSRLQ